VHLELSPEQQQLRDAARRLLASQVPSQVGLDEAAVLGWLGLGLPEKVGGAGTFTDLAVLHEELGRGLAPSVVTTVGLAGRLLLHAEASSVLLEQACSGEVVLAGPSPFSGTTVRATSAADGVRLDGTLEHVVDARSADRLVVPAVAPDGSALLVMVASGVPGLDVREEPTGCDVEAFTLRFDGVPADEVVARDAGTALDALRVEATVLAAARAVGGGRAVLDRTVTHVSTRHQFGRAIGTFQAVQHQLADVATALDGASLLTARAAWAVEAALPEAVSAASMAGLAAQQAFREATLVAHQLHGGMGFVLDSPLHLWSARAVADPTAPRARRRLLDALADRVEGVPHHRAAATRA
jgi:alkylation response protein AidB-like acyl-CoA dehydrogenase